MTNFSLAETTVTKCPIKLVPGTSLKSNSRSVKKIMFKEKYCFQIDDIIFTEATPIKDVQTKLLCDDDYDVENGIKTLPCSGADLIVDGIQGSYKIKGLRVKALEPADL
jgi:hypothetical protein